MSRPLPPDSAGLTDLLVRTADAWRNGRALLLLAVAGALFVLRGGTSGLSGQFIVFMIGSLAGLIVLLGGVSAARAPQPIAAVVAATRPKTRRRHHFACI